MKDKLIVLSNPLSPIVSLLLLFAPFTVASYVSLLTSTTSSLLPLFLGPSTMANGWEVDAEEEPRISHGERLFNLLLILLGSALLIAFSCHLLFPYVTPDSFSSEKGEIFGMKFRNLQND